MNSETFYLLQSSLAGILRGFIIYPFIYPLEALKVRQQLGSDSEMAHQIALRILQEEGVQAFYRGLSRQLIKTSLKQIWCWPMITGTPRYLEKQQVPYPFRELTTGVLIATVDALGTTPLEKAKIQRIISKSTPFSWRSFFKENWRGCEAHWLKLSVSWSTFLISQKFFREKYRAHNGEGKLNYWQLTAIGCQVALIVSFVSAPFDRASTLKLSQQANVRVFDRKFLRGGPLYALCLLIHNIASVILIELLEQVRTGKVE